MEGRLGAGGMGQVYLGSSPSGRAVAVKLIRTEHARDPRFRMRFSREVEAARQVGGFHTAQVLDADPHADFPWLVTAFIPGPTLQRVVAEHGPLASAAVARLGAGLAEGLAAIHRCGLVHRDLKPGNVIMADDGPRIIDFGIAHAEDGDSTTGGGAVIGTYAYMSPEQARAEPASAAGDVFSLGSVLVFAATGRGPFDATTVPGIVHRITSEPPWLGGLDGELRALLVECLAKDPADRPSAADVLNRLSVTGPMAHAFADAATTPGTGAPLGRRTLLFGGIAAAATAIAVPTVLLWPNVTSHSAPAAKSDVGKPLARLDAGDTGDVTEIAFSPDGRTLAGAGFDRTLRLWDITSGRTVFAIAGHRDVLAVTYSADGQTLFSGDNAVRRWDVHTGESRGVLVSYARGTVTCLAFSPDEKTLAVGLTSGDDSRVEVVDMTTGRSVATFGHNGNMNSVAFSPDGETVASVSDMEAAVRLWSAKTGRLIRSFTAPMGGILDYASAMFSPDGKTLAGAGPGIKLWDVATGRLTATFTDSHHILDTAAYRPGRAMIAGAGRGDRVGAGDTIGKTISLWDLSSGRVTTTLTGVVPTSPAGHEVPSLAFSPDGGILAASMGEPGGARWIQLWKLS
ncbi:protein kinase [Actinoallomurus iriomotensis]|uniref:Protein kinase n=1 Tax=Actinoallomurus iriomotensis TaxID=478107 RepID=A0A9W6RS17_9ACTN|nr:protein kinase [Actinoallomurus iriomotensis]